MNSYIESLNNEIKGYFNILSLGDYPKFINKYINTKALMRLSGIGMFCGVDYQKLALHDVKCWYSRLDHSIACALITWRLTHDKKQTLAALFHDIGTPAFSHAIDYMYKDFKKMESSEKTIKEMIQDDMEILVLLNEDNLFIDDINKIKEYTIVENDRPKLCADRIEGLFSNGLVWGKFWELDDIRYIYKNVNVSINDNLEKEIGFKDIDAAIYFYEGVAKDNILTQSNEDKLSLCLLGDIMKIAIDMKILKLDEMYQLSELEIIKKMNNSDIKDIWQIYTNMSDINRSDTEIIDCYGVTFGSKRRIVDPLVNNKRLTKISDKAKDIFNSFNNYKDSNYAYIKQDIKKLIKQI
jgi:uncharacterized protein